MLATEASMQEIKYQQNPDVIMAQLADLNDEIGADDWTIARDEITKRKLIKQTPRYKVYKADWFGDVIVYEPIRKQAPQTSRQRRCNKQTSWTKSIGQKKSCNISNNSSSGCLDQTVDYDDFRIRLDELCLSLGRDCTTCADGETIDSEQGVDSAYSSISSTPQYYTKHNLRHEFEFPSRTIGSEIQHHCDQLSSIQSCDNQQEQDEKKQETKHHSGAFTSGYSSNGARLSRKSSPTSPSVVLNKDSFPYGLESDHDEDEWSFEEAHKAIKTDESNYDYSSKLAGPEATLAKATTSGGWSELNELRLVAHENFMLFMGASIENSTRNMNDQLEQTTSLVMQMSHPKSVSLHDLLHADKTSASRSSGTGSPIFSPTNRFFTSYECRREPVRRQLTIGAKLNICQQVTDAMTYLHDKNIVHGRLTSVNVYIEPNQRVKISLIDTDERQIVTATVCGSCSEADDGAVDSKSLENSSAEHEQQPPVAEFNLPTLTYLSPELIRTIRVAPAAQISNIPTSQQQANEIQMDTSLLTKEADVFSFGTLLFELFEERFPFSEKTKPAEPRIKSPARLFGTTTKLVNSLCLDSPTTPKSNYYFGQHDCFSIASPGQQQKSTTNSETKQSMMNWNGNIKASASELIYQIGSGQIASNNSLTEIGQKYPALVEHIISACWRFEPTQRPGFKQLRFE